MAKPKFNSGLTFDDVLLEPRASRVQIRTANLETNLTKKLKLRIPILSAAMDTVTETEMAVVLGQLGGMAVLHRNCSVDYQLQMLKAAKKKKVLVGAAVGPHDTDRAIALDRAGVDAVFVDCAHAHNLRVIANAKKIKKLIKTELIVGNIGTREAARELSKFADAIKVGIGPGAICTTRVVAGVGVPQLTAVINAVFEAKKKKIPVIADGGIKYSGDVVKALSAGASAVMLGSMLAGTKEAPGKIVKFKGHTYKTYRGMGSLGAMKKGKSSDRYFQSHTKKYIPEGVEGLVSYKGLAEEIIYQITGGLKSGMGYIGANTIADMEKQARFIKITPAALNESHPHTIQNIKKAPNY